MAKMTRMITDDPRLYARKIATASNYAGVCPVDFSLDFNIFRGNAGISGYAVIGSKPRTELSVRNAEIYSTTLGFLEFRTGVSHEHSDNVPFNEDSFAESCISAVLSQLHPRIRDKIVISGKRGFVLCHSLEEAARIRASSTA